MAWPSHLIDELCLSSGGSYAVDSVEAAYARCVGLAKSHYENFPVASLLIPKTERPHISAVYCFARVADDVADDAHRTTSDKLRLLDTIEQNFRESEGSSNPIVVALASTCRTFNIPIELPLRLLEAFRRDSTFRQAENWEELLDYCRFSANPVGELVLRIFRDAGEQNIRLSDDICSALQLINFWQDFSVDLPNGRCYVPRDILQNYGLSATHLATEHFYHKFPSQTAEMLGDLMQRARTMLSVGASLTSKVRNRRLALELCATVEGGSFVLNATEALGSRIFTERPRIRKSSVIRLLFRTISRFLDFHS